MADTPTPQQKYTVAQDSDGSWMVIRPSGTVAARLVTQAEAEDVAHGYNVTFGFSAPEPQS